MRKRLWPLVYSAGLLAAGLTLFSACTSVRYQPYPGFENLPATPWKEVRVFWTDPRVSYQPIGEVVVRGCGGCSLGVMEDRIKIAVSDLGGDLGIVVRDEPLPSGTVSSGSASQVKSPSGRTNYTGTLVTAAGSKHDIIVIAAILEPPEDG